MILIKDANGFTVATGDQKTGVVERKHGGRGMRVTLSDGQMVSLTREGTITHVTRSPGGFIIDRQHAKP